MPTIDRAAGYFRQDQSWANVPAIDLSPDAAVTADGDSGALEIGDKGTVRLTLAVSAHSGSSPTLDVAIETSEDGVHDWVALDSFTQVGAANPTQRKIFTGCDRFIRATFDVGGGSPSYTFTLRGEAVGG